MANDLKKIAAGLPKGCWPVLDQRADGFWHARISGPSAKKGWTGKGKTDRAALLEAVQKAKQEDAR